MTRTVELVVIHDYQRLTERFMEKISKNFDNVVALAQHERCPIYTETSLLLDGMWEEYVRRN